MRRATFEESQINCMHLCLDNRYLVVGGSCVLRVYDLESAAPRDTGLPDIPTVARFECSGQMNFTSIGSFRLRRDVVDSGLLGLEESSSDFYNVTCMGIQTIDADVSLVLYATSEDGYVRFFDGRFNGTLRTLKTIRTGVAITCSILSPDYRFLLTGSQIGQISVWHLPSVIASIALENKKMSNSLSRLNNFSAPQSDPSCGGVRKSGSADEKNSRESVVEEVLLFGNHPLQTISFENDYSAIRSVCMSPVGWWGVAATHCGNLHFICLSKYASVPTAKSRRGTAKEEDAEDARGKDSENSPSHQRAARRTTYASALEANSQRITGRYPLSQEGGDSAGHSASISPPVTTAVGRTGLAEGPLSPEAIDAAELRLLQNQKVEENASSYTVKTAVQRDLEMIVFHSFPAHRKYILKVVLAPNNSMIVTCSADYSLGRFVIPEVLQVWRMNPQRTTTSLSEGVSDGMLGVRASKGGRGDSFVAEGSLDSLNVRQEAGLVSPTPDGGPSGVGSSPMENIHVDPESLTSLNACFSPGESTKGAGEVPPYCSSLTSVHFPELKPLTGHVRWVWDCAFTTCSSFLFSASSDTTIRMWNGLLENDNCPSTCFAEGHKKPVVSLLLYNEGTGKQE